MANLLERWMDNRSVSPFRDLTDVQVSFDRLFNEMMKQKHNNGSADFGFTPSCEISEEEGNYTLKFDLPGVKKEQVKVETDKNQLTVRAERKEEKKSESKKKYLNEVYYGSYVRSFTLPSPIDEKKIGAHFENGVLTITVPKGAEAAVKQIPIQ